MTVQLEYLNLPKSIPYEEIANVIMAKVSNCDGRTFRDFAFKTSKNNEARGTHNVKVYFEGSKLNHFDVQQAMNYAWSDGSKSHYVRIPH